MYERVWDEADYVVPPAENGAFFVTTNVVITPNQTRGHCPEVSTTVPLKLFLYWAGRSYLIVKGNPICPFILSGLDIVDTYQVCQATKFYISKSWLLKLVVSVF